LDEAAAIEAGGGRRAAKPVGLAKQFHCMVRRTACNAKTESILQLPGES